MVLLLRTGGVATLGKGDLKPTRKTSAKTITNTPHPHHRSLILVGQPFALTPDGSFKDAW